MCMYFMCLFVSYCMIICVGLCVYECWYVCVTMFVCVHLCLFAYMPMCIYVCTCIKLCTYRTICQHIVDTAQRAKKRIVQKAIRWYLVFLQILVLSCFVCILLFNHIFRIVNILRLFFYKQTQECGIRCLRTRHIICVGL